MTHHELKAFDGMFEGFADGRFTATIRNTTDRIFRPEDTVTLREGYSEAGEFVYSGREVSFRISAVTLYGCADSHAELHLKDRNLMIIKRSMTDIKGIL